MAEYIEAKSVREFLSLAKGQKGLMEDEETFERKGKRRMLPPHIEIYQQKLMELKEKIKQRRQGTAA